MRDKMIEINDKLIKLSISRERAFVIAEEIDQDYFDLTDDTSKLFYFEHYKIMMDVLYDYLARMDQQLGALQGLIER